MASIGGNRSAYQTYQVADVSRIEHTEAVGQAESSPVPAQDTMGDRVKRARLHPPRGSGVGDLTRSPDQFSGRTPTERDEKDPLRRHSILEEPRQSAHQCPSLAGTGACRDEQRATLVVDRLSLHLVESACPFRRLGHDGGCHTVTLAELRTYVRFLTPSAALLPAHWANRIIRYSATRLTSMILDAVRCANRESPTPHVPTASTTNAVSWPKPWMQTNRSFVACGIGRNDLVPTSDLKDRVAQQQVCLGGVDATLDPKKHLPR